MAQVETLLENMCKTTGEGPHWDDKTNQLLFVDIEDHSLHRWSAATATTESEYFDQYVTLCVPCEQGGYVVGVGQSIVYFDWTTKQKTTLATVDQGKSTRMNDGKADASGRLWFGTMGLGGPEGLASLYSLDLDGTVKTHKSGVSISNGLAWTADNRTMYYIDSTPRKIYAFDFDLEAGSLSNERVIISFGGEDTMAKYGYPDGMTIDTDGMLWVACYSAGRVVRFDPSTGQEIGSVDISAKNATSCCFGGPNFDELYITSAKEGSSVDDPMAGTVFRATGVGARGKAGYVFKGNVNV